MSTKLNWQAMTERERDWLVTDHIFGLIDILEFSTCPKAAMEVVEAMRGRGYVVRLDNGLDGTWEAFFYKQTKMEDYYAPGDTMPEAVCKAALLAVGVEVE